MTSDEAIRVIYRVFPGAEVLKLDGSRKKLSHLFERAADVKTQGTESRQRMPEKQQLSFDFVYTEKGGAT
jgi:predicted metal-dependent phosphoesterase TrpH